MLKTKSYSSSLLPPLHSRQHVSFNEQPNNRDLKELSNQTPEAASRLQLGEKA
jgi:hypothetical protein